MPTEIKKVLNRIHLLGLSEKDAVAALSIFSPMHLLDEFTIIDTVIDKSNNDLLVLAIDNTSGGWAALSKETNNETKNTRRT